MAFLTALTATQAATAAASVTALTSVAAARQASAAGRYNQAIANRNFRVKVQEAEQIEKDIIDYNANVNKARKFEEANFARMSGQVARNQARSAELGYYAQAGTSLLTGFST